MIRLFSYFKSYKRYFIIPLIIIITIGVTSSLQPLLEGFITTEVTNNFVNGDRVNFAYIIKISIILIFFYTYNAVTRLISNYMLAHGIQHSMKDVRNLVQQKIHKLPVSYFDSHQVGDIMSRMTNDIEGISNGMQQCFSPIISSVLSISIIVVIMITVNFNLSLIALGMILIDIIVSNILFRRSRKLFYIRHKAYGELTGFVQEKYSGYKEITLYNKQEDTIKDFKEANHRLANLVFKSNFLSGLISPIVSGITYATIALVVYFGSKLAIEGIITIGILQTFIKYIWRLGDPISNITQLSAVVQSTMASNKRIISFLDEEEETKDIEFPVKIANLKGNVEFKNVSFSYRADRPILRNLSFKVKPGMMVAIVGPTGSGKTTLINLLMRFYDVNSGEILVDGININKLTKDDLRTIFGMVLQDTWLFKSSIKNNIGYGSNVIDDDKIIEAAKLTNVHHFISTLPGGYNMTISEEADNISQGEKQLLTIARAIIANPKILILDEATSTVDTRLELMLQEAMKKLLNNKTSFVIAHRLSTIKNADLILVIKDGVLIESGTHDVLMNKDGFYKDLYLSQFSDS